MSIESLEQHAVPLRVARPAGPATTGVVVLHQAAGYSPQIEDWLLRLAGRGHLAVAPLLLHRHGVERVDPAERFGGDLGAFAKFLPGDPEALADFDAAADFLRAGGIEPKRTGVVGFSYGGRAAYLVAAEHALGAAVTFYGNGIHAESFHGNDRLPALTDRVRDLRTPWLGLYGERDFLLAEGELDDWEQLLPAAPVPADLVRYPEAGHAFDVDTPFGPGGHSPYHPEATKDAIDRALGFLDQELS